MSNTAHLTLDQPFEIDDARVAARTLSSQRRDAITAYEAAVEHAAAREKAYRVALAKAHVQVAGEGSAASRDAEARKLAADAAYDRDLADGLVRGALERVRALGDESTILTSLIAFSSKVLDRIEPPADRRMR